MAPRKKVNRYDEIWEKLWCGGSEEVSGDAVEKLEKRKVLSGVEKAGVLSKVKQLRFTLSSALASVSLLLFLSKVAAVVLIPYDSAALVAAQAVVADALGIGAAGLFVGSVVLGGIQESD